MPPSSPLDYHVPTRAELTRRVPRWVFGLSMSGAALLASFIVFVIAIQISDAIKQRKALQLCARHVPIAQAAIANDPRFSAITFHAWSKHGSALLIDGYVAQAQDLAALQQVIDSTKPFVRLDYRVMIGPPSPPPNGTTTFRSATRP